jgi:molybdopterin synthase catalytic subunit
VAEVHRFLRDERAGGLCVFVGTTRRWTGEVETARLSYEAYEAMAAAELARLAEDATSRWPILRCVALHRLGVVEVGEASVVVGVSCEHRDAAFEAARWLIDTLKAEVPIWKQDLDAGGLSHWV